MKTLKKVLSGVSVDSDTKKFIDKHVVTEYPDAAGNGDDVFKATNVNTIDRKKDRHGYTADDDHKVYEDAQPVDEKLGAGASAGDYIADFKKSDAPQFKGKSQEKRRQMGIAAYMSAKNESVEDVTEGEEAHAQFQKYHAETAKLLKNIHTGLSKHYDNVTSKKNYNGGEAHWGHVGDIKNIHRQLQDIHDGILAQGEYAKPPKAIMKESIKEDLQIVEDSELVEDIVQLYDLLDESQQQHIVKLLDGEQYEEILNFIETLGDE